MLKNSTDKGTERLKLKRYAHTKYSSIAYTYLKEYYEQEGDKNIYAQSKIGDSMQLKIEYISNEGMNKYICAFEYICEKA